MYLQVLLGSSIGLLLGLLMGLSASPVTALVVGALAALLASLVLPQPKGSTDAGPARHRDAAVRATALGLAAIVGIVLGLWIRTHDLLSPPKPSIKSQVETLESAGFSPEEAKRLVASKEFPGVELTGTKAKAQQEGQSKAGEGDSSGAPRNAPPTSAQEKSKAADLHSSALFKADATTCEQIKPGRFANTAAAASAYEKAGHKRLTLIAQKLLKTLPDEKARQDSLNAVVEGICADV